mmetsp:Transcript_3229/g.10853  ORF Transcript_3229/g.10853 Transcript_3229/m.10853 type:complete len:521 (+) Transcript_3229:2840-4402(+)
MRLARLGIATREDHRLKTTIKLRKGNLEGDLHRVQTEGRVLPFFRGLERKRDGHHVWHVELLQGLDSLRVILARRTADEGETSQRQDGVDVRTLGDRIEEESFDRAREVETTGEDRNNLRTLGFEFGHHTRVVAFVAGDQVRTLENETDNWGIRLELDVLTGVIPVKVLLQVLVHGRGGRVPDADIREHLGFGDGDIHPLERRDVRLGNHQQEVLQVVRGTAEPVLQRVHKVTSISRLVRRQVLQHLGQRAHELQHALFETARLLLLAHKGRNGRLRLTELSHGERTELVQSHDLRHGREDQARIQVVAARGDNVHNLLGELFDEDQRSDEDVGRLDILLERSQVVGVTQLFEQVTNNLNAHLVVRLVNLRNRGRERGLVLRLQHDVHNLNHDATLSLRNDAAHLRVHAREHTLRPTRHALNHILLTLLTLLTKRTARTSRDGARRPADAPARARARTLQRLHMGRSRAERRRRERHRDASDAMCRMRDADARVWLPRTGDDDVRRVTNGLARCVVNERV